jgi:hypothetical protein
VALVDEGEEALHRPGHRRVALGVGGVDLAGVRRRRGEPLDDRLDPLGRAQVVRHDVVARHAAASRAKATTTPVRSLPAAQCTSTPSGARAIARTAAATDSGRWRR